MLTISRLSRWSINYYNDTANKARAAAMDRRAAGGGLGEYYSESDTRVPTWVVVLILARELLISGLRTLAAGEGLVIAASQGGKWKTSLQLTGIIALMVHYHYSIDWFFTRQQTDFHLVGLTLLYLSLIPSLASAAEYVRGYYTLDGASRERGGEGA